MWRKIARDTSKVTRASYAMHTDRQSIKIFRRPTGIATLISVGARTAVGHHRLKTNNTDRERHMKAAREVSLSKTSKWLHDRNTRTTCSPTTQGAIRCHVHAFNIHRAERIQQCSSLRQRLSALCLLTTNAPINGTASRGLNLEPGV